MEQTERLFDILGQIDPALIAAVDLTPKKKSAIRKWLPAVACLCLCAVLGLATWRVVPKLTETDPPIEESKYPDAREIYVPGDPTAGLESAFGGALRKTTGYLYDNFTVGDCHYHVALSYKSISPTLLGEALGTAEAANMSPSVETTKPITYYRILGIRDTLAVAVIFDGEEDIYLFANQSYVPATLGELITDAGLEEYLTMGEVKQYRADGEQVITTVYQADTALTEEYLFRPLWDSATVRVHNGPSVLYPATDPIFLSIRSSMNMFGYIGWADFSVQLSYNGYLIVPLFGNYYLFPVEDTVRDAYLAALKRKTNYDVTAEPMPARSGGSVRTGTVTSAEIYYHMEIDGDTYKCSTAYWGIDAVHVGEELGQVKAGAADTAPIVTYYRLRGIAPEAGVAVRFPGEETYYSYYNNDYRPETLGDLIEDLDLHTTLRSDRVTVNYREATVTQSATFKADTELLLQHVFASTDAPFLQVDRIRSELFFVETEVQLPLFSGSADYALHVTGEGWLYVYLMQNTYVFDIGYGREQVARYASDLILRYPFFSMSIKDEVKCPIDKEEWESAPDRIRYSGLEWENTIYATAHEAIDLATVGEVIGSAVAVAVDPVTRMLYHKDVTLYAVDGYSTRHAVGVRFGEAEEYDLYVNHDYISQTLGDFIEEYGLYERGTLCNFRSVVYGENTVSTIQSTGYFNEAIDIYLPAVDPARAWELLFGDPDAPQTATTTQWDFSRNHKSTLTFTLRCEGVWDGEADVIVDKNGYLCFTSTDYPWPCQVYEIGRERAEAFLNYVLADCLESNEIRDGKILIPAGGTRLDAVREQLSKRFAVSE